MTADYVVECHPLLGRAATATFDGRHVYRYSLTRRWARGPVALFVMLNPSTADAATDDPTLRRCAGFARTAECGGLVVLNLYALRFTDPAVLAGHPDPVGPLNDHIITQHARTGGLVIAAWGAHPIADHRAPAVTRLLHRAELDLWCLGTTQRGAPRHPLYVPADTALAPYPDGAR